MNSEIVEFFPDLSCEVSQRAWLIPADWHFSQCLAQFGSMPVAPDRPARPDKPSAAPGGAFLENAYVLNRG
jgi:hypothetical protein